MCRCNGGWGRGNNIAEMQEEKKEILLLKKEGKKGGDLPHESGKISNIHYMIKGKGLGKREKTWGSMILQTLERRMICKRMEGGNRSLNSY